MPTYWHTVALLPDTVDGTAAADPTADQQKQTPAAQAEADPQPAGEQASGFVEQ
ncbi:hypothetical protein [Streptomyces sp. AGS-58]|uniref:hypothetical protein n=1 Tax=unclassified Streptomyces TaxID=2593676 RepID=UPI0035A37B92